MPDGPSGKRIKGKDIRNAKLHLWTALIGGCGSLLPAQLCIAHRGDVAQHPENTLEAIRAGGEAGADLVEVDVQLLADRTLVLFHDDEIKGVNVQSLTYSKIQALTPEVHLPTLQEVFEQTPEEIPLLLDLKSPTPLFVREFISFLHNQPASGRKLIFQSKDIHTLKSLRTELPPDSQLYYVTSLNRSGPLQRNPHAIKLADKVKKAGLNGITAKGRSFVDRTFVKSFKEQGLHYFVWTINDPERMKYYRSIGVDGIITDEVKALNEVKKEK